MDKSTYINSQTACAMIEAMAMQAENEQRKIMGQSMAYTEQHFLNLIDKYGISSNNVITYLSDYQNGIS